MIHYQLTCAAAHAFDGWFRDSAGFDAQARAGLVTCPECGSARVQRALMAPSIGRRRAIVDQAGVDQAGADKAVANQAERPATAPRVAPTAPSEAPALAGAGLPDQVKAMLQKLRAEVERTCEHVGDRFAEEARAIHSGAAAPRGIFGQSTPEEAEALAEDGIQIAQIPWVPRADG